MFWLVVLLLSVPVFTQDIANKALLPCTWSTGSGAVMTGPGFCTPANTTFSYPANTGISISFTADGYYELARYRFKPNAVTHKCITGVMGCHHGKYTVDETVNSITLTPFDDGFQQIQNPCEAVTNFIENYNQTEFYKQYQIFNDPNDGYKLHLFGPDGAPLPPMFCRSQTPIMNPTRSLRNTSVPVGTGSVKHQKRNAGEVTSSPTSAGLAIVALVITLAGGFTGPLFF